MSDEIDNVIIRFIKTELRKGHFEHTIREITRGTGLSYNEISKGAERLKTKGLIRFRKRGRSKRFVPYYYLTKLVAMFESGPTNGDPTEKVNTKKHNSNLFRTGGT